jgi:predicted dehydrogenase
MRVKWGIVSTARINLKFMAGARDCDTVELFAVASRDQAAAERYAAEHGLARAYGSYEALLADPEVEAVYISLPNGMHAEWATRALEAGKHVLCEKPLSRRPDEVRALFELADRRDRLLMEAFMYRHNPQTQRLLELVRDRAVGPLRMIAASFSFNTGTGANIRLERSLDGGALMDVGCYCVNGIRALAGEPERVSAEQITGGDGVDVTFAAALRMPGGVLAHFDAGLALAPRHSLEVVGEDGALFVADPWHCRAPGIELRRPEGTERIAIEAIDSYGLEAENFSRAVRGQGRPLLGREDALGQARAIEALYASADAGGQSIPVSQPPP